MVNERYIFCYCPVCKEIRKEFDYDPEKEMLYLPDKKAFLKKCCECF